MTDLEITAAVVEICPKLAEWDEDFDCFIWKEGSDEEIRTFDPCNDQIAMQSVENSLGGILKEILYPNQLLEVTSEEGGPLDTTSMAFKLVNATPRQRAEALLRACGKWRVNGGESSPSLSKFVISISDGYVEYSYPWELPDSYSIDSVRRILSSAFGRPPLAPGSIRTAATGEDDPPSA
jgi:hypothetical protein